MEQRASRAVDVRFHPIVSSRAASGRARFPLSEGATTGIGMLVSEAKQAHQRDLFSVLLRVHQHAASVIIRARKPASSCSETPCTTRPHAATRTPTPRAHGCIEFMLPGVEVAVGFAW